MPDRLSWKEAALAAHRSANPKLEPPKIEVCKVPPYATSLLDGIEACRRKVNEAERRELAQLREQCQRIGKALAIANARYADEKTEYQRGVVNGLTFALAALMAMTPVFEPAPETKAATPPPKPVDDPPEVPPDWFKRAKLTIPPGYKLPEEMGQPAADPNTPVLGKAMLKPQHGDYR